MKTLVCEQCNKKFDGSRKRRFCPDCSHERQLECRRRNYDKERKNKTAATKTCIVCGCDFICPPSRQARLATCSPACNTENRKRMIAARDVEARASVEQARMSGLHKSPLTGHYETHIHAGSYTLKTPNGQSFSMRNLRLWVDLHADDYGAQPNTMYNGFIRAIGLGRRGKEPAWNGWRIERIEGNNADQEQPRR